MVAFRQQMCFSSSNLDCNGSSELFGQNVAPQSNSFYTNFNHKKQTSMQKMYKNTIAAKFVKAFLLSMVVAFASMNAANAQTTLINPSGDGGFENGNTFTANGWTVINNASATSNNWVVGTTTFASGTQSAYVSNTSGTTYNYDNTIAGTVHMYRTVTVPAGESKINLSFSLKSVGEQTNWDQLLVFYGTGTPILGTPSSTTTTMTGFTNVFTQASISTYSSYATVSVSLPGSLAGTSFTLDFVWKNDGSGGSNPPASVDNISLTSATPANFVSNAVTGNWSATATWSGGVVPSAGDNVTIVDGATVTIDAGNPSVGSLTIGGGTSGTLQYTSTAQTLTTSGDVIINAGAKFLSAASGSTSTIKTHVLSVGGNLTNNGTLNFSATAGTSGTTVNASAASITFTGASDATFDCSGATLTNLYSTTSLGVVLNKGTSATSILNFVAPTTYQSVAGATSSGTTITVSSTAGLSVGMYVSVTSGTGAFAAGTTILSVPNGTQFTVSTAPTTALSGGASVVTASKFAVLSASLLTGSTAGFLTITNGTFKVNGSNTFLHPFFSSTGYTIPSTGGFWLNNANVTVTGQGGSPTMSGLLRMTAGTYNVGTTAGNSMGGATTSNFIIEGGTMNFVSRLNVTSSGASFNMSSGTINISTLVAGNTSSSTASFGFTSATSVFTMSGGTINLVNASTGSTQYDWQVATASPTITGGTLNIGTAATATKFSFTMSGAAPNLVIDNTTNNKTLTCFAASSGYGTTTINSGTTLNLNGFTFTERGSTLTNNGILALGSGTLSMVSFTGILPQTIAGSGTVTGNLAALSIQNSAGVTITHTNQLPTLRVNLFYGTLTGSGKVTMGTGAALAVTTQIGASGLGTITGGNFDVSPTWNLGTGTYSVLYLEEGAARTSGLEVNPTRTLNALTVGNNNGVTLAGGSLSTGTLTLSGGKLTTSSSNLVTVTGTTTGSVVRSSYTSAASATSSNDTITVSSTTNLVAGMTVSVTAGTGAFAANTTVVSVISTTKFKVSATPTTTLAAATVAGAGGWVNGPLAITLPASLVSGSTYNLPVGKSVYNNFELINPTTNAGGTVVVQAEAFDASTGGTVGTLIGSLNTNRYWAASITSGAGNFTNSNIRLNDVPSGADAVAGSATKTGAYDLIGGVTSTVTASSIATTTASTSLVGFYAMGNKAAATLSSLAITPTGNQCTNVFRTVTVTATPGGAAIDSVVLIYQVNGATAIRVPMTNTSGTSWTANIPTVSPANASVTWSVTAYDANSLTKTQNGTTYTDAPLFGITPTASASSSTTCSGSQITLTAAVSANINGARTAPASTTNTTPSTYGLVFDVNSAFTLNSVDVFNASASGTMIIQLQNNSGTVLQTSSTFTVPTGTGTTAYTAALGWSIPVGTGYRLLVTSGTASLVRESALGGFPYAIGSAGSITSGYISGTSTTYYFLYNWNVTVSSTSLYNWSWNSGAYTGTSINVNPTSTTSYTATATSIANGCTVSTAPINVTVNPLPTAPTFDGTNPNQCGTVTYTVGGGTLGSTYNFYTVPTGGVAVATNTTGIYTNTTPVVGDFNTVYVSVTDVTTGCTSDRTQIDVFANTPLSLSISQSTVSTCVGRYDSLSVTTGLSDYDVFSWAPTTNLFTNTSGTPYTGGNTTKVYYRRNTATASETITLSAVNTTSGSANDGCSNVASAIFTVNANPTIAAATATPSSVCSGSAVTLNGTTNIIGAGTVIVGTGTLQNVASSTTSTGYPAPYGNYYGGAKNQMLITAADLTAAGLSAGNITSVAFDVVTPVTTALSGFNISMKSTALSALTAFETTGFTTVYSNASYTPSATAGYATNTISFSSPFNWDGSSNIIIQTCFANADFTTNAIFNQSATAYQSVLVYRADLTTVCTDVPTITFSYSQRPNMKFGGQTTTTGVGTLNWSWSNGTSNVLSAANGTVNPTNTPAGSVDKSVTYTVTGTSPIAPYCSGSLAASAVTVKSLAVAPTNASTTPQCGTPTFTVTTGLSGFVTYKWYDAVSGGNLVATTTSSTGSSSYFYTGYTSGATNHLYVSVTAAGGCESARTDAAIYAQDPPALTINTADTIQTCVGNYNLINVTAGATSFDTYVWTANTNLFLNNTGTTYSGNPTTVYYKRNSSVSSEKITLTATNNTSGCVATAIVVFKVGANPVVSSATITPSTLCNRDTVTLTANGTVSATGTATLGAGGTTSTSVGGTFLPGSWGGAKTQYIVRASELAAAGVVPGNITSLGFEGTSIGQEYQGFTVSLAHTSSTTAPTTTFIATGLVQVYKGTAGSNQGFTPALGVNTLSFGTGSGSSSSFTWDGSSNLVVTISWSRIPSATTATVSGMKVDVASFVSTAYRQRDSQTPDSLKNETSVSSTTSNRPKFIFGAQVGTNLTKNYTWTWSTTGAMGTAVVTGDTIKHSTVNNGSSPLSVTYTAIATDPTSGCYAALNGTAITVNPSPTAPTSATAATQCGLPTFTIDAVAGMTYKWYAASSGGTAIVGATNTSYTPATYTGGGATNTYWSTVTNTTGCESARFGVSTIVNDPPAIAIQSSGNTICANNYATLNLTAGTAGNFSTVTWSPITNLFTDMSGTPYTGGHAATVYYKRSTTVVNEVITAVGTTSGGTVCINNTTVSMTVNANPNITSVTATPTSVCSGSNVALNGITTGVSAGTVTVGAGASSVSSYNAPFYSLWSNKRMQIMFKAAELTSFGMFAGNITTVSFPTTSGTVSNKDYTLKMKLSTGVSDMSAFVSSGFTTVYTSAALAQTANTDNTFSLDVPFYWDGTSDVIVEMCWGDNTTTATLSSASPADATSYVSVIKNNFTTASSGSTICANASNSIITYSVRPQVKFGAQTIANNAASFTWVWSTALAGNSITNGSSTTHTPTNVTGSDVSGTYDVTVTNAATSCFSTATTSSVTVKPVPAAPTDNGTVATQCGVPTYAISTGVATPTINWYTVATNSSPISSSSSLTYNYSGFILNATNTLYASVSKNGCEGPRTAIAVYASSAPSIALNQIGTVNACVGRIDTLSVSGATVGNYTNFSWSPTTNLYTDATAQTPYTGTGNPTTVYYKNSSATSEIITLNVSNNGSGACVNNTSVTMNVNSNPAITTLTATPNTVCSGATVNLNGTSVVASAGSATIGTATTTEFNGSPYRAGGGTGQFRVQYLVSASELTTAGIQAGNLTALTFSVSSGASAGSYINYTISLGSTSATVLSSTYQTSTMTQVYTAATYSSVVGDNTHTFNTPFNWDGTSNILVNICYTVNTTGTSSTVNATTPTNISNTYLVASASACTATSGTATANRPLMTFAGQVGTNLTNSLNWAWSTTLNGTSITNGASTTHTPTNTTSSALTGAYNVVVTNPTTTCVSTGSTNTVTVNYALTAPTDATAANQCGTPTYNVTTSETGATINWYTKATGGSALSSGSTTSYVYATYPINPSGNDTLWASISKFGCESGRTMIVVAVSAPPALALTTASSVNTCVNRIETISVTGATAGNYNTFTWSPTTNLYTDANATVAYNGTGNPTTVYYKRGTTSVAEVITVNATNASSCLNVKSVSLVVNANPVITAATISSANICSGDALLLNAASSFTSIGTATVGIGTVQNAASSTTSTGYPAPFGNYYGGARNQMLITAADLTAAGLSAGNITSVAFDVATANTTALSGFSVQVKSSSLTSLTSFETTGFTTVYSAATYTPSASTGYAANTINFSTPFNWDGTSNIIVQTCFYNTGFTTSAVFNQTATSYQSTLVYRADGTDVCASSTPVITFSYSQRPNMRFGGTIGVNYTPSLTWNWSNGVSTAQNTASGTIYPTNANTAPTSATYTVTATDANTCSTTTSPTNATVTVNPGTVGGTPSSLIVCSGFQPSSNVSLVGSVGTIIKWQKSTDITFASAVTDIVNSTTTLTAAEIGTVSVPTYLRAVVKSGACSQMYSDIGTLTPVVTVGGTASSQTVCYTGSGTIPSSNIVLTGYQGSVVKWQKSTDSTFTTGVVDITSNSVSLSGSAVGAINTTTYVRALIQNATCSQQYSRFGTLTAYDGQTSTISISTTSSPICSGSNTVFHALASNPGSTPVYVWKRNGNVVGTNSNAVSFASGVLQTNDQITCEVTSSNPCASPSLATSNTLTLTVLPSPAVGAIYNKRTGAQIVASSFCNFTDTLFVADNTINGTWSTSNSSVGSVTTYPNTANRYAYVLPTGRGATDITYTLASAGCASTSTFTLKVAPVAVPSTITAASSSVCVNSTLQLSSATTGGTWAIIYPNRATTSNTGLVTGKVAGTTPVRYTVANDSGCSNFTEFALTVNALPAIPTINYAPGTTTNPQAGAPAGGYCIGRKFNVAGTPTGGHWTFTNTGVATITDSLVAANNWWGNVRIIGIGSGNIVYTITNANNCSISREISGNGVTCASKGVDLNADTKPVFDFTLYPNPAKGRVSFNVEFADADGKVVLTDMYGKQIKTQSLSLGTNQIDINNLSKGFYLVSVINNDGTRTTKKLIVE